MLGQLNPYKKTNRNFKFELMNKNFFLKNTICRYTRQILKLVQYILGIYNIKLYGGSEMTKRTLVPEAAGKLQRFKMEVAEDMALDNIESRKVDMGDVPSNIVNKIKNSGNVGGEMVKRMVEAAEKNMVDNK